MKKCKPLAYYTDYTEPILTASGTPNPERRKPMTYKQIVTLFNEDFAVALREAVKAAEES